MFAISADCTLFYMCIVPDTPERYRCMCVLSLCRPPSTANTNYSDVCRTYKWTRLIAMPRPRVARARRAGAGRNVWGATYKKRRTTCIVPLSALAAYEEQDDARRLLTAAAAAGHRSRNHRRWSFVWTRQWGHIRPNRSAHGSNDIRLWQYL